MLSAFVSSNLIGEDCNVDYCPKNYGLYQGVSFGTTLLRMKEFGDYSIEKTGLCIDLYHGYQFQDAPISFEQKISFNAHCFGKITQENDHVSDTDHTFTSFGVTENVIIDFSSPMESGPYIGIGGGYKEMKGKKRRICLERSYKKKIKTIGLQGILGFNFRVYPVMDCSFEYKCFRARKCEFIEHSLSVNFKKII